MAPFPSYTGAQFSPDDVEQYLIGLTSKGWQVFARKNGRGYIINLDIESKIDIYYNPTTNEWLIQVSSGQKGKLPFDYDGLLNTFSQFEKWIVNAAEYFGINLESSPSSIRLKATEAASNRVSIVKLAGSATVNCVFDPYFEDKSIKNVMTLINLGLVISNDLRVLTTKKMRNRLSQTMIDAFNMQYNVSMNIRFCKNDSEHRRFLLLSNGEEIIIGCSLNSLEKNETAHREPQNADKDFFESEWNTSTA